MVLSASSERGRRKRYLARTIPAGQSLPPHPSERSSLSNRGLFRRPSNETLLCPAPFGSLTGTNDSLTSKGAAESDDAGLYSRPSMQEQVKIKYLKSMRNKEEKGFGGEEERGGGERNFFERFQA